MQRTISAAAPNYKMLTYIGGMKTAPFYNSTAWKKTRALKHGNAMLALASSTSSPLWQNPFRALSLL